MTKYWLIRFHAMGIGDGENTYWVDIENRLNPLGLKIKYISSNGGFTDWRKGWYCSVWDLAKPIDL